MKILFLALESWRKDNSLGNSYSSIFGKMEDVEIAHIFSSSKKPDFEKNITRYYQIKEEDVIKSVYFRKNSDGVGKEVSLKEFEEPTPSKNKGKESFYSKAFSFGKKHHWILLYWARDLAWRFGHINYDRLMDFVKDFNPDLIFFSFGNIFRSNRLALYLKEQTGVPLAVHMQMDHYTLKRFSFSPLFWIDKFLKRKMIRKLARKTEVFYCISERLKNELEANLHVPCKVLYKIPDNERSFEPYKEIHKPIRFLFTGNIGSNRWKTLSMLAKSLQKLQFGHLDIYTANPITQEIENSLNIDGYSSIHGPITQSDVIRLQNEADVLVHVEAFDIRNRLLVRGAISTKIMDYLSVGRSILAIGPEDIDSMAFLRNGDVAMMAHSENDLMNILKNIKNDNNILFDYAQRGVNQIHKHYDADTMRTQLYNELKELINK